jgi:hypothetical protein
LPGKLAMLENLGYIRDVRGFPRALIYRMSEEFIERLQQTGSWGCGLDLRREASFEPGLDCSETLGPPYFARTGPRSPAT